MVKSYRDLEVWQSGMDLATECYRLGKLMPKAEEFRVTSPLLWAATFVPANLAKCWMRSTRKEFAHFVNIARGSLAEVETLLLRLVRTGLMPEAETASSMSLADKLGRQLNRLRTQLAHPQPPTSNPQS